MRASHVVQLAIFGLVVALLRIRLPARSTTDSNDLPSDHSRGPVELSYAVWGMPWEDLLFEATYAREFERLMQERGTPVRIRYLRYAGELVNKYNTWHLRGTGADVMRQHFAYYDNLLRKGINEPLDRFIFDPKRGLADQIPDFIPEVWNRCRVNGHFYAVPEDQNQLGLFYNKDLFDRYNAAHPNDRITYPDASWTWNDLRDVAEKLTVRRGRHIDIFGFDMWPQSGTFFAFLFQAGGKVWNGDQTRVLLNSPAGVEVLNYWRTIVRNLNIARPTEMRDSAVGPDKFFEFGKTAMFIDGTWRIPDVKKQAPGLRFGVAPLPLHPRMRKSMTVGGCCLWAMSAHSKHKDLAWEFIRYLVSQESNRKYWDILWVAPPARLSAVFSEQFKSTAGIRREGSVLIPGLRRNEFSEKAEWMLHNLQRDPGTGRTRVSIDHYGYYSEDLNRQLNVAIQKFMLPGSKLTARQVLDDCVREVHTIIDRDRSLRQASEPPKAEARVPTRS